MVNIMQQEAQLSQRDRSMNISLSHSKSHDVIQNGTIRKLVYILFSTAFYYRVMHMHKRGMPSPGVRPSVCLSVCPSVTFVSCAKTNKDIVKIFSPSGSHTILVFPHQTGWRYSDGNPPNGGVECKGVWKIDDFRPISRSISETVIVRWTHAARQFVSIEFSFQPYNI